MPEKNALHPKKNGFAGELFFASRQGKRIVPGAGNLFAVSGRSGTA